mgnify:CR=1 FL=1
MGKGDKKIVDGSFMSKHAQNLLNYMPIDDRAGSRSDSGLNYNGSPLYDKGHGGASGHTHENDSILEKGINKVKKFVNKYDWSLKSRPPGGKSLIKHSSKGGNPGFSGDTKPQKK